MFSQTVRRLTTTAVMQKLVTPPIQVFGMEGRYATALYSAASKSKNLDAVQKDMDTINQLLTTDTHLRDFCVNPSLQRATKVTEFGRILEKLKMNAQTKNMFAILAENGRLARIQTVLDKFSEIMSAHRGEVVCVVRTAKALDRGKENELRTALGDFLKPGENLHLTLEVDPSIIGGMVVSIGDRFVDMSIARKVRTYRDLIEQPL